MNTPTITAEIRGPQACGKTQLFEHLRKLLEEHPFKTRGIETPVIDLRTVSGDRIVIDPAAPAAPVLVPLGPNVTRDGRKARVICNDLAGPGKKIIAAIESLGFPGAEVTSFHFEDGRVNLDGTPDLGDLVGHLPPEPRKPREWGIIQNPDGEPMVRFGPTPEKTETVRVQEIL